MDTLEIWFSFIGSWFLFAGAVYQSSLELRDEEFERARLEQAQSSIIAPPRISAYWWLLPPVKIYLERSRSQKYNRALFGALPAKDKEALISFKSKANGWLFVACGALCIAISESSQLFRECHTSMVLMWVLVAVLVFTSVLYAVLSGLRIDKLKKLPQNTK